jgi:protein-disulfide isomerase
VAPELIVRYVENGTLRMEWRDFPYLGQKSVNAALAARAAQEQGKFWEYRDLLYENQGPRNSGAFSDENLIDFAREAGLDTEQFEESLTSGKHEGVLNEVFREAQDAGIQGTPTFTVNGRKLVGPQPVETFGQAIEEESGSQTGND